jgi:hypothetical protein
VTKSCIVEEGDRVAQLVIEKIETPSVVEVDVRGVYILHSFLVSLTSFSGSRSNPPRGKRLWLDRRTCCSLVRYQKHLAPFCEVTRLVA